MTDLKAGDTFRAHARMGALGADEIGAVFTVEKVTKSQIVYAKGQKDALNKSGRRHTGTPTVRTMRFKLNDRTGRLEEFRPSLRNNMWVQDLAADTAAAS